MLTGLTQDDHPLTLQHLLERARRLYADAEITTVVDGGFVRASYAEVCARVDRLCRALESLGVERGDRVATFAWNSQRHLELYLAVPCMGAVLHTINIRLFSEQIAYIANHAEDRVMFVDDALVPALEEVAPQLETVRHYVIMGDGDTGSLPNALRYEDLLEDQADGYVYPALDDRAAAALCYTSGTTGNPKGVLYSHRCNVMHAAGACMADSVGVSSQDRVLPIVPMFHANAWGLPYAAVLTGAELVLPGAAPKAQAIAHTIADERVTIAAAVPTVWLDVLEHVNGHGTDLSWLRTVVCGGAAVPLSLMQEFERRHGVRIIQAWGMTETGPLASLARPPRDAQGAEAWRYRATAGRVLPLVEARVVGEDGAELPWDGASVGELEVRGPWVASGYFRDGDAAEEKFDDGWLRTGDIAALTPDGYIRITDRAKDVIKSGGEWISSVDLENELVAHADVLEAAVIAKPDGRWTERPLACVVLRPGSRATAEELREHLRGRVAKWWLPEEFAFIDEVPKTGTGKFDKKVLRQRLAEGSLGERTVVAGSEDRS